MAALRPVARPDLAVQAATARGGDGSWHILGCGACAQLSSGPSRRRWRVLKRPEEDSGEFVDTGGGGPANTRRINGERRVPPRCCDGTGSTPHALTGVQVPAACTCGLARSRNVPVAIAKPVSLEFGPLTQLRAKPAARR